jgi:hypothetical protein
VEDAIEGASRVVSSDEKIFEGEPVSEFTLNKLDASREEIAPSMAQVVKNERLMSLLGKKSRNRCTNVPSTPSNQYPHKKDCPFVNTLCTLEVYYNRLWPEGQVAFGREFPKYVARSRNMHCNSLFLPVLKYFRHAVLKRG